MKRTYLLTSVIVLTTIGTVPESYSATISATIGDTNIPAQASPIDIEGKSYTWNGVTVTVTRYPSNGTNKARIAIVSDGTKDEIGVFNAQFTAAGSVANFPINFQSSNLTAPPTTSPGYYYVQGAGSFVDNSTYNGILTTVGKINPDPGANPNSWTQIGNTLTHNTASCSCLSFSPSLGYKTYAQSSFADPRGLKAELLLNLGDANDSVQLAYVKVNSGPPPGKDESVEGTCEDAKENEPCEEPVGKASTLCKMLGWGCPRCYDPERFILWEKRQMEMKRLSPSK